MNKITNIQRSLIIFAMPLLIIATMVLLAKSSAFATAPETLSFAITLDLLLTSPLIYFLLIRKTSIPKTTVIPFIILGVITCSFILPLKNQYYLNLFKTWILPIMELFVLLYVISNIVKARQLYKLNKRNTSSDFFTILRTTCYDILPKNIVVPFVTEIAVFYYGFLNWKVIKLKTNEFSYHKNNGTLSILIALIILIAVETTTIHFLLAKWSILSAWILTGISIYSALQVFGFLKSMTKRPIIIENNVLYLRYGIMSETSIAINTIENIVLSTKDLQQNKQTRKLSFLGDLEGHNVIITLKKKNTITGLYGIKKQYKILAFYVDEKHDFKNKIDKILSTLN